MAGAAVTTARDEERLTFVTTSGQAVTCTASVEGTHSTNNPDQPEPSWDALVSAPSAPSACFDDFAIAFTATYKDSEGVTRTLSYLVFNQGSGGSVTGAYTATTVRADVLFFNCDASRSASCNITVTASPK